MNKSVPFVPNTSDGMHYVPAVFKMIYKYYFNENLTWKEIDKMSKTVPRKGTWTFLPITALAKKGLKITHIEPLDYKKLHKHGVHYLRAVFGKKTADYYINRSNIGSVLQDIPEFINTVKQINRKATINDILKYLKEGVVISVEINSSILNKKPGFNLHYILVYDYDGQNIVFHDPGLPPIEGRKVTIKEFDKCFNYPGGNSTITVFKKLSKF